MADPACWGDRINSYAIVSYIPGALGHFITKLREELVSGCVAQSHVTILPPRALFAEEEELEKGVVKLSADFPPFLINMPRLSVFRQTSVIFAEIGAGYSQLVQMHESLATGPFAAEEPFEYHPHITLAQGILPEQVDELLELARRRWAEAPADSALIENLTFVQNTVQNRWIDLMECELKGAVAVGR
jgi:2'-5' RNA ligase